MTPLKSPQKLYQEARTRFTSLVSSLGVRFRAFRNSLQDPYDLPNASQVRCPHGFRLNSYCVNCLGFRKEIRK